MIYLQLITLLSCIIKLFSDIVENFYLFVKSFDLFVKSSRLFVQNFCLFVHLNDLVLNLFLPFFEILSSLFVHGYLLLNLYLFLTQFVVFFLYCFIELIYSLFEFLNSFSLRFPRNIDHVDYLIIDIVNLQQLIDILLSLIGHL